MNAFAVSQSYPSHMQAMFVEYIPSLIAARHARSPREQELQLVQSWMVVKKKKDNRKYLFHLAFRVAPPVSSVLPLSAQHLAAMLFLVLKLFYHLVTI